MKPIHLVFYITLISLTNAFSQNNEIAQWYLQYIEKDGIIYPNYYNETQDMDIVFIESEQNSDVYEFTAVSSCNFLAGTLTSDVALPTVSSVVYINGFSITNQDCDTTPRAIYESLFLEVFTNNNSGLPVELSYEVTPIENNDPNPSPPPPPKLTLTNSSGDSLVYYLTLPTNGILVQEWFLSRIEVPGNDDIVISESDFPSLNITNGINGLTFNTLVNGTGVCNTFQGDYEVTFGSGNSIQILDFSSTDNDCSSTYETTYFSILSNITTNFSEFEIINNGTTLIITDLLGARLIFNDDLLSAGSYDVSVNEIKLKSNPVGFKIELDVSEEIINYLSFSIFSIDGKQVRSQTLDSNTIDVSYLNNGLYFIKFYSESNQIQTLRFIKQ